MYRLTCNGREYTIPKENFVILARYQSKFTVKIDTVEDAIKYFNSVGVSVVLDDSVETKQGVFDNEYERYL